MFFITKRSLFWGIALAAMSAAWTLHAEEAALTPREKMLLEKVEQLEKRVVDLEKRLSAPPAPSTETPAPAVAPDLAQRVEKIEKTLDEKPAASPTDLKAFWKEGLRFETADKRFKLQLGLRLQTDVAFYNQSGNLENVFGDEDDGGEIRRGRIDLKGTIYDNVYFRTEYEFAGDADAEGRGKFTEAFVGVQDIPVLGSLQVGHFREPFGLERLTNTNMITFMEGGLPEIFAPGYNLGVMAFNTHFDQRLLWMLGAFKETDEWPSDDDSDEDQGYAITARLTGLPYYKDKGRKMLELGMAYSHRNPDGAPLRYRNRPESHLAFNYLDTERYAGFRIGDAVTDNINLYGLESLFIYGPFSLQGEYMLSEVDTEFSGTRSFSGYYLQGSYFFTGENRVYDPAKGVMGRVKPNKNFSLGEDRGWGAWELAARYSALDLDDGVIRGGMETDYTLGLNWYLNPNTKVMWNYVYADIDHDLYDGNLNILQTRFQIDF